MTWWQQAWTPERWRSVLALGADEREVEAIRIATQHGVPLGDQEFIGHFTRQAGRDLTIRPVGRPKSSSSPAAYTAGGTK